MVPIFKKGDKRNITNYRGITSLCSASKLLEIIVHQNLFFQCKNYISTDQHGFYPGRSVTTNLLVFTSHCLNHMENRHQVDAIYTDFKAAFDRIDHHLLVAKLKKLGVSERFAEWLLSYLSNRKLQVKIGDNTSNDFSNTSGVPQGSNLGPLLFSVFVNDICSLLPEGCRIAYADDVKIYITVKTIEDCHALQRLLNDANDWCKINRIVISVEKCCIITFSRRSNAINYNYSVSGVPLTRVNSVKDLGVILDDKLNFNVHRSAIIDKANRQLGFIKRVSNEFDDPTALRSLYCALVRPVLEFASIVWGPYQSSWSCRIEQIQKRFVRFALRNLPWRDPENLPSYEDRCQLLSIDTLHVRRKIDQATFVGKVLNAETDCPAILSQILLNTPSRPLRQRPLLFQPFHRSEYGRFEPISSMQSTFERASELHDFHESSSRFRSKLIRSRIFYN